MKKNGYCLLFLAVLMVLISVQTPPAMSALRGSSDVPYKVYVILGFHANFYHSWRGDTPDEAGFGTDIRVVREILRMLDEANAKGLDARGYWEGESLFTFEDIIPNHAPDIIEGIRRRIKAGHDEFMPAPYSNTLFSAATEDEMRKVVSWSISNPWGSGAQDLFGSYVPLLRPQEGMGTAGMIPILKDEGIEGLVYAYSTYSFTTFSNFVPLLPVEERYGLTWVRMRDDGPQMLLFPCVSAADVVNFISVERWLLDLRKLQTSGRVEQDLVIHINFDADAETWLPMLPGALGKMPNAGGLQEYIDDVNKYEWAEFAIPSEFLATHQPRGEVVIRQDLADGGWDGNYSWAEKYPSHVIWTGLEASRLYTDHAQALMGEADAKKQEKAKALLYKGRDSSFFQRVRGLSTTHFGMSTPMVNEERQAVAERVVGEARDYADRARRLLARELTKEERPQVLYSFLIKDPRREGGKAFTLLRMPVILDSLAREITLYEGEYPLDYSLVDVEKLPDGRFLATIMLPMELEPGQTRELRLERTDLGTTNFSRREDVRLEKLSNQTIELVLDPDHGVKSFSHNGEKIGGENFLDPFITYVSDRDPVTYRSAGYEIQELAAETWTDVQRSRISTTIPFATPHGEAKAKIETTFTLPVRGDWVVADVTVDYPYTVKEDIIHNMQQKLRRYLDLRWIEVAPFQLHPLLSATRREPVRVWKHNWLDVTSYYDMNYADINPKNAEWDSMNHQVTAGWVAVTDKQKGLLIGESAERMNSYAFAPMRLRETPDQRQQLWVNPMGSYYGKQADYSHMGGTGVGSAIADLASAALRPNGPSYNGQSESFSLLLAPYEGDCPPERLQDEAELFFHPPAVVYTKTPDGVDALFKEDIMAMVEKMRRDAAREKQGPLPKPIAFLANPTEGAVDLVWDEPMDARIDGYQVEWKEQDAELWNQVEIERANRFRIEDLENGRSYSFRVRSVGEGSESEWTEALTVGVGPVESSSALGAAKGISMSLVLKTIYFEVVHFLTTP